MNTYNNGKVIDVSTLSKNEYYSAAKEWSEGNYELEQLLIYCLENNIVTQACCAGHENTEYSFIQFDFNENNMEALIAIISKFYNTPGVLMDFVNQPGIISKLDIRINKEYASQFFKNIKEILAIRKSIKLDDLSSDMLAIINAMITHKTPHEYLEFEHSLDENGHKLFVATTNPNYSETYWDKPEAKPWVEDSISIEGKSAEIEPIIKDIGKKTKLEYSNYIENQRRQQTITSASKVQEYNTIVFNSQATRENEYARANGLVIAEILPGMDLTEVAKEIVGKDILCIFNGFTIEGRKYTSIDELLNAYNTFYEQKRIEMENQRKQNSIIEPSYEEPSGIHR